MLEIILDSHIRIKGLSDAWILGLSKLCSFTNEEKEIAIREHVWGAENLDDLLTLAEVEGDTLILPRGFLDELKSILKDRNIQYKLIDNTMYHHNAVFSNPTVLKADQLTAYQAIVTHTQGRIIAPPGKGKTIIGLQAIDTFKTDTLILVEKKHIAQQWVDKAKQFFDMELGFIGDNKWEEKRVTVALIQTLWSRKDRLTESKWWDKWNVAFLDEQHHIPAETFTGVVSMLPAKKRYGLSATIGKSKTKSKISELVFGPILYEDKGTQIVPHVKVVKTDFEYDFERTHRTKEGKLKRNNYQQMITELAKDNLRNCIIAEKLLVSINHCNLVVSDRLAHLKTLHDLIQGVDHNTFMLTGKESLDERMAIYEKADKANCTIFSTLASEALDIPRIDRVHLVWPRKNSESVWQIIGRGTRIHPEKTELIVYDYVDHKTEVLYNQYKNRLYSLYKPKGFVIEQLG